MVARLARHLELALVEVDLSPAQYRVLSYLDQGGAAASALANKLAVTRPSITAVVDGLVAKGLVERKPDPGDRRRVDHLLTEEGRRTLASADAALERHLGEIAGCATGSSADAVLDSLSLWRGAMDDYWTASLPGLTNPDPSVSR